MTTQKTDRVLLEVSPNLIFPDPDQPRKDINPDTLNDLADSIKAMGIEQPINVRVHPDKPDHYMIISGERRWRASQIAGLITVPIIVRTGIDAADLKRRQLAENYHRDNFNPVEEAEFLNRWVNSLLAQNIESPQTIIANELGIALSTLSKKLAVLKYSADIRAVVRDGLLRDKDALSVLNSLKEADRKIVIEKVKTGEFDFKEFKKNTRRTLKELRAENANKEESTNAEQNPSSDKAKDKPNTKPKVLTRWNLSRESIISIINQTEFIVLLQDYELESVSDETLLELFEKFKVWLNEKKD